MGTLTDDDLRHLLGEAGTSFAIPEGAAAEVAEVLPDPDTVRFTRTQRRLQTAVAAAAVLALALVGGTALFGGNDVDRVGQLAGAQREPAPAAPVATGGENQLLGVAAGGGTAAGSTGGTSAGAAAPAPAPAAGAVAAPVPAPAAPVAADGARVVKTGAIALLVEDDRVSPVLGEVQALAAAAGGVVASAKTQESGPTPSGTVTLRVPVDRFEEVVAKVRGLDVEVLSATTSGADVTTQYADLETQLRTLKAARERFLEILSRARNIGDVLAVQQRIDDVTGQVDRIEGQRQVLADQSDRATLQVSVTEKDDVAAAKKEPDTGLSKAFSDAWTGFTTGVEGLIRLSGRGVLLVLCLTVAFAVARLGWRASRRRMV